MDVPLQDTRAAINDALERHGRLAGAGEAGARLVRVQSNIAVTNPPALALRLISALDAGGNALGAIEGPAQGFCWWGEGDGSFALIVSLRPVAPGLERHWLRALARDAACGSLPAAGFATVGPFTIDPESRAEVNETGEQLERATARARGHSEGRRRAGRPQPSLAATRAQREALEQRQRRLKLEAVSELLRELLIADDLPPLPEGRPLWEFLPPADYELLYEVLGARAAVSDLAGLGPGSLAVLGVSETELSPLVDAGLLRR